MIMKMGYKELVNLILSTRERLIVCMPGLPVEVAKAILTRVENIEEIRIITAVSEESIRNGYGDIEGLEALIAGGVSVYSAENNMISFIIADEKAYFLFPQSRIISDNENITNAVEMNSLAYTRLLAHFFPPQTEGEYWEYDEKVDRAALEIENQYESNVVIGPPVEITMAFTAAIEEIKDKLKINPPLAPDLQRQIKTYNAEIAFVEFQFKGMNFNSAKVTLPSEALPFKDETIKARLETRMRLFGDLKNDPHFKKIEAIKKRVSDLRREFLIPIASREKSIIRLDRRAEFDEEITVLKALLIVANQDIDLWLETEVLNSRDRVKNELLAFLKEQPPENLKRLAASPATFEKKVDKIASDIVSMIKFPEPSEIMTKMEFQVHYYDITWDDFRNQEFLDELAEKKVFEKGKLEQIVKMRTAYETKRDEMTSPHQIPA